ncbi:MAG: STAS domain-containing protein [Thermoanaerobaculia bacterium]|nr:STAS domain-containing protein [Thermoanaerobaculia bacterium]
MKITRKKTGDVLIVRLSGWLTADRGDAEAAHAVLAALKAGERKIVLDLHEVPIVDSAGLGALASARRWAERRGAALCLASLPREVEHVMAATRLLSAFTIYGDEGGATTSLAGSA